MPTATLEQIRPLIDQLSLRDQARLLEYLTPRVTRAVVTVQQEETRAAGILPQEWRELFRIGDAIAQLETPQSEMMTTAVTTSRR
jgi:methylphosphotriester-DNA--protein-cysteine methyltransferase